jgi:hypothetical protein
LGRARPSWPSLRFSQAGEDISNAARVNRQITHPKLQESGLRSPTLSAHREAMPLPSQPITLSAEQIEDLNRKLSNMRHDINNQLSLIMAAVELIHYKPQMSERMMATLSEQPPKIATALVKFTSEFEQALSITRP